MLSVTIPKDHISVPVIPDILEMDTAVETLTSAFKAPTTAAKMALCVIILRDRLIALVNLDLPEMDTAAQILTSVPRAPSKTAVNMLIVTIPLDHTNVHAGMDILEMVTTARSLLSSIQRYYQTINSTYTTCTFSLHRKSETFPSGYCVTVSLHMVTWTLHFTKIAMEKKTLLPL